MTEDEGRKALEAACVAICRTRKLVGPQGTCAAICMEQLGNAPARGCSRAVKVHGDMAKTAVRAYLAALPGWRLVPVETEKGGYGTRVLSVVIKEGEKWPPPPGLEDSE